MRTTIYGLALLGGAAVAAPVLAQTSPAAPNRNPPAATMQESTRPATPAPAPATAPAPSGAATTAGPTTDSGQSAVRVDEGTRTAGTPQPGANSFTEGQARGRIEAAGFSNVTDLTKDDQGIWRGRGMRNGQQVGVALDFTGAVSSR
jgi:hypothetical protein